MNENEKEKETVKAQLDESLDDLLSEIREALGVETLYCYINTIPSRFGQYEIRVGAEGISKEIYDRDWCEKKDDPYSIRNIGH